MYQIMKGNGEERAAVAEWLDGLDLLSKTVSDNVITAWVSAWRSSPYVTLEDIPYSPAAPAYGLTRHVNEVTRTGLDLARRASVEWDYHFDMDVLVSILILHDIDKPLIYVGDKNQADYSRLGNELPHGVVGAMLLREIGFPHTVVSTVATHAANAPFHGSNPEAYVLHYADMFATDHTYILAGLKPFYQKHIAL